MEGEEMNSATADGICILFFSEKEGDDASRFFSFPPLCFFS